MLDHLRSPFVIGSHTVAVTASVGAADASAAPGRVTSEDLRKNVDLAMYAAKERGKNAYAVFEPSMRDSFDAEMALREELHHALADAALYVVYQPIVDLADGRIIGVEALARWRHPTPRRDPAGRVHPGRRAGRDDRRHRPLRAASGVRRVRRLVRIGRRVPLGERVAAAVAGPGLRRAGAGHPAHPRPAARPAGPGGHRERAGRRVVRDPGPGPAARGRPADRHRRLRHRLLVAALPAPAARRHHQDRPELRPATSARTGAPAGWSRRCGSSSPRSG